MRAPEILQHSELKVKRSDGLVRSDRADLGGPLGPDPESHDLAISERVIGVPGDTVAGHEGRVFVNGKKAEDIPTNHGRVLRGGPRQPAKPPNRALEPAADAGSRPAKHPPLDPPTRSPIGPGLSHFRQKTTGCRSQVTTRAAIWVRSPSAVRVS